MTHNKGVQIINHFKNVILVIQLQMRLWINHLKIANQQHKAPKHEIITNDIFQLTNMYYSKSESTK